MSRETIFSPCRKYRYTLWRTLAPNLFCDNPQGICNFLMLNPSTADETQNDPTVRRCINYATVWGFAELVVTNIFAFRATDPEVMKAAADPVGPDNDRHIANVARQANSVICAWGSHGEHMKRGRAVIHILQECGVTMQCLNVTQGNHHPAHPLYLSRTLLPKRYTGSRAR